jgi:hypothetical protein
MPSTTTPNSEAGSNRTHTMQTVHTTVATQIVGGNKITTETTTVTVITSTTTTTTRVIACEVASADDYVAHTPPLPRTQETDRTPPSLGSSAPEALIPKPRPKGYPLLDHSSFPHILDAIVRAAPPQALLNLRSVSREMVKKVDPLLCRHIKVEFDNLRTRHGRIWLSCPDKHFKHALVLDLTHNFPHKNGPAINEFGRHLKNVKLVRAKELNPDDIEAIACISRAPRSPGLWVATFLDASPWFKSPWPHPEALSWKLDYTYTMPKAAISHCVINIAYNTVHSRLGQTPLSVRIPHPTVFPQIAFYIIFTPRTTTPWSQKKLPAMPPIKPCLLNTLLNSLIVPFRAQITLVDVESWSHQWLQRKGHIDHHIVEETTPSNANMETRLRWWVNTAAALKMSGPGTKKKKKAAMKNVSFKSMEWFRAQVDGCDPFLFPLIIGEDFVEDRYRQ